MSENREFFEKIGTAPSRRSGYTSAQAEVAPPSPPGLPMPAGGSISATGQRRWAANDAVFWAASETHDILPPGLYRCEATPQLGYVLLRQKVETDDLLALPDDATSSIITEFQAFWKLRLEFTKRGFLHKRGFLLWGPPGSGKTSTVQLLAKELVSEHSGVVAFIDHPSTAAGCLQMIRRVEPTRPLIVLMEDLDALVERYGENEFLALLDGEAQVDNVVYVATTNYPERLDRRFVDRPSRFDTVRYVGMPSAAAREVYLKAKEPSLQDDELALWVRLSEGLSVAHLKEMIIANRCFEKPIEEVAERMAEMHRRQPTSGGGERSAMGFAVIGGGR